MARLEASLGVRLFQRSTRRLALTEGGERLLRGFGGALVRLLPGWSADGGPISLYYASKKLLPARTRVFVDFMVEQFEARGFARMVRAD